MSLNRICQSTSIAFALLFLPVLSLPVMANQAQVKQAKEVAERVNLACPGVNARWTYTTNDKNQSTVRVFSDKQCQPYQTQKCANWQGIVNWCDKNTYTSPVLWEVVDK